MITDNLIIEDLATLKEKLAAISLDILTPGDFHDRLAPAIRNYSEMLFGLTQLQPNHTQAREHIYTPHGKAIGTFWAAFCTNELIRTQRFCRGLYKAVTHKLQQNSNSPVHVVYAGTGPFAALALPVIMQFKPSQLQFTLLEINPESYNTLTWLLKTLGLEAYIKSFELCDAITWKVPNEDVDIVISETMNRALIKEPQINIMLNMVSQLPDAVIYIPQAISVDLAINQHNKSTRLNRLYTFNKESYQKIIAQSTGRSHWVFDATQVNYSPHGIGKLVYIADIIVYADETLTGTDCSLNMPHRIRTELPQQEAILEFKYQDGLIPGFEFTVIG